MLPLAGQDGGAVSLRFSRADRLVRRAEFDTVYGRGLRAGTKAFTVFLAESSCGHHRLGLSVSRRVGKAVIRNRVRRRLREVFRLNRHRIPGAWDIVLNARREAADLPIGELADGLVSAVRRAAGRGGK